MSNVNEHGTSCTWLVYCLLWYHSTADICDPRFSVPQPPAPSPVRWIRLLQSIARAPWRCAPWNCSLVPMVCNVCSKSDDHLIRCGWGCLRHTREDRVQKHRWRTWLPPAKLSAIEPFTLKSVIYSRVLSYPAPPGTGSMSALLHCPHLAHSQIKSTAKVLYFFRYDIIGRNSTAWYSTFNVYLLLIHQ